MTLICIAGQNYQVSTPLTRFLHAGHIKQENTDTHQALVNISVMSIQGVLNKFTFQV